MRLYVSLTLLAAGLAGGAGVFSMPAEDMDALHKALDDCRANRDCDHFESALSSCVEDNVGCFGVLRVMGYPEKALEECVEGAVQLNLEFGVGGEVVNAWVIDATPAGYFEESAIARAKELRFDPESSPPGSRSEFAVDFSFPVPWCDSSESPN